jgi:thiosulfate dehydrogenase (quinone) large subunit
MIEKLVETGTISSLPEIPAADAATKRRAAGLPLSLYVMQLILAYEWLLSGLDKVANPSFGPQLPTVLRGSTIVNRYGWYSTFLKDVVLPHASLLAPMVELAELAIGTVLIASAALWMWQPLARLTRYVGWAACMALVGAVLLSLNYSFQQGTPLPWIDAAQAFSPGMGIDMLIALLSLPLLVANLRAIVTSTQLGKLSHPNSVHGRGTRARVF